MSSSDNINFPLEWIKDYVMLCACLLFQLYQTFFIINHQLVVKRSILAVKSCSINRLIFFMWVNKTRLTHIIIMASKLTGNNRRQLSCQSVQCSGQKKSYSNMQWFRPSSQSSSWTFPSGRCIKVLWQRKTLTLILD